MTKWMLRTMLVPFALALSAPALAAEGLYQASSVTPETAYKAAKAALERCRKDGYQVTVAVVDRSTIPLVVLRDRFAGVHTVETAIAKARTAVSFKTATVDMIEATAPGRPEGGIRNLPGVVMVGGGVPFEASGGIVGGIGISGAPGGEADHACALVGIEAILESLTF